MTSLEDVFNFTSFTSDDKYEVKGKSYPCALTEGHAIKTCWGSGGIALRILDLGTRWR
jgi:hypothetical protein